MVKGRRRRMRRGSDRRRGTGRIYIGIIVVFLIGVLGFQLHTLHEKSEMYGKREAALVKELEAQQDVAQELSDYEQYTKSEEYMENTAKSKLGLINENEIIFREEKRK